TFGGGTVFWDAASPLCCPLTRILVCPDITSSPAFVEAARSTATAHLQPTSHDLRVRMPPCVITLLAARVCSVVHSSGLWKGDCVVKAVGVPSRRVQGTTTSLTCEAHAVPDAGGGRRQEALGQAGRFLSKRVLPPAVGWRRTA